MEDLLPLRMLSKCGGFILIQPGTHYHACMHYSMLVSPNGKAVICCALALRFLNAFARASFIENRRSASYKEAVN